MVIISISITNSTSIRIRLKNYADPSRRLLLAEVDSTLSTLRDLHNSSDHTKAESNSCFITHLKLFML